MDGVQKKGAGNASTLLAFAACFFSAIMLNRMNLDKIWEQHTRDEFVTRDVESTLATMVEDAYVNHIPVMTMTVFSSNLHEDRLSHSPLQMHMVDQVMPHAATPCRSRDTEMSSYHVLQMTFCSSPWSILMCGLALPISEIVKFTLKN